VAWHVVANSGDLEEGSARGVRIGRLEVALFRLNGSVYATADVCPHGNALLSTGYVDGDCIECPLHQALFHVPTGEARSAPATDPVKTYPARDEGGLISIELPG
jgi:nitrite reductase/ring-hydroxylating ferredoxin subunit